MSTVRTFNASGVDTFNSEPDAMITLRVYEDQAHSSPAVADVVMTPAIAAETIADLAYALRDDAKYSGFTDAINSLLEAEPAS